MTMNMSSPDCPHEPIVEIPLRYYMELMQLAPLTLQARLRSSGEKNPGILLSAWYYVELLNAAAIVSNQLKGVVAAVPVHEDDEFLDMESDYDN